MENYSHAKSIGLHSNLFLGSDLYMKAENNALDLMFFMSDGIIFCSSA